jgi:hypothetical protein
MDKILEMITRGVEHLLGRADGSLHFRLVVMPTVVTILAIRAGLKDAREVQPEFLWAILTDRARRPQLVRSGLKDIGRIFIVALQRGFKAHNLSGGFLLRAIRRIPANCFEALDQR